MAHSEPEPYSWYLIAPGDTDQRVFQWKDSTGTPINITGYTAKLIIDHSGKHIEITIPSGQIVAAQGQVTAIIDNSISEDFTVRTGKFRLTVTSPAGEPKTIAFGPLTVVTI